MPLLGVVADMLKKNTPSRVVNVSSVMHNFGKIQLDNLNAEKYFPRRRIYSDTKLCNVVFTQELARRLEGTGKKLDVMSAMSGMW